MRLESLSFPQRVLDLFAQQGILELNPPQTDAIKAGLLGKKNLVIASSTASGKTLIAELAFLRHYLDGGKTIYLVPLKALASEKYHEFKEKYKSIGLRVAMSVGDLDEAQSWLGSFDVVIMSNEKADSVLRHNDSWITKTTLIVCDEIHLLNDASRGPTLEMVLTRLRMLTNAQVLALSATIANASELAVWLGATLVSSMYRPIPLEKGIFYQDADAAQIEFLDDTLLKLPASRLDSEVVLADDALGRGKQSLVFVATRRSAEAAAEKIGKTIIKKISKEEQEKLDALSDDVLSVLSHPTKQCKRLAALVKNGAAFHHAGLLPKQRQLIEDSFRSGLVKSISSTTTLAYGLNLPAYRVVIRDTKRFSNYGMDFIPVMDVHQCMGRAGRPRYDVKGEAVLVAKNEMEKEQIKERYLLGESEEIYSKLSAEPMLRMHTLALIASGVVSTIAELQNFYAKTFFAHQYGSIEEVMEKVQKILEELASYNFILCSSKSFIEKSFKPAFQVGNESLVATPMGKRISELYLDPLSAHHIVTHVKQQEDMGYLVLINQCFEMHPLLRIRKNDDIETELARYDLDIPDAWDIGYEEYLMAFKTALLFSGWMSETNEDQLVEEFDTTPGELYEKTKSAERMLYAAKELALIAKAKDQATAFNKLYLRMKHGVKEELLPLVALKGIGRARARKLYRAGIKTPLAIKEAPIEKLVQLLGEKVAQTIKQEIEQERDKKFQRIKQENKESQE